VVGGAIGGWYGGRAGASAATAATGSKRYEEESKGSWWPSWGSGKK
jgi:hypothetical protein